MEFIAGFVVGAVVLRAVASLTRNAAPGSVANRIHIAVVGPWRPR